MEAQDCKLRQPLLDSAYACSEQACGTFNNDGARVGPGYGSISGGDGTQEFVIPESRKIGVAGAVFLILNKMIGTGSMSSATLSYRGLD